MKRLKKINITSIIKQVKAEGVSMRRRFVLYIISAIALVLSLILLLLNLFGVMNPTNARVMEVLDTQLLSYTDSIEDDYDKVAAHALSFSDQIEEALESFLVENNLAFEDLKNNTEALSTLQLELYNTVYLNMQLAPNSGAFYIWIQPSTVSPTRNCTTEFISNTSTCIPRILLTIKLPCIEDPFPRLRKPI